MNSVKVPWWVFASMLLSAGLSLLSLSYRYRVEQRNRAVTIALEVETVEAMASSQGQTFSQAVDRLKNAGLGALVASEETVRDLLDEGRLQLGPGGQSGSTLFTGEDHGALAASIGRRFPSFELQDVSTANGSGVQGAISFRYPANILLKAVVGLRRPAEPTDLPLVARFSNSEGNNAATVEYLIADAKAAGAKWFLPMGDQVLGRRENLETLEAALRANDILYADPEFVKMGGTSNLRKMAPDLTVRLHSAQAAELDKMSDSAAIERYVKAAAERGQRILLLRPINLSGKSLDSLARFVNQIAMGVRKEALELGWAHPYEAPAPPQWLFPAIGLAAAPVLFFVASAFLTGSLLQLGAGLLALLLGVGAMSDSARPFTALACAIAFPTLAFLILNTRRTGAILVSYVHMTVTSLIGGLCVAGLLNGLNYLVVADQFAGVKLAHYLPVLLVGAYFFTRLTDSKSGMDSAVRWSQAVLFVVIMAALGLMFLRTGNDNPEAVSGLELQLRALLEKFLSVRPRTKEILFGHPALIVGLGMLALQTRLGEKGKFLGGWTVLALTLGAIGQTSVVNTMCHLHTPLVVGLLRIAVGAVVGGIIGALVWAVLKGRLPRAESQS